MMEAGKHLADGNWKQCYNLIKEMKFWNHLPNIDVVRGFVKEEVKKQSLRCYFAKCGPCYKAIRMDKLIERFELPREKIQKFITRFCIDPQVRLRSRYDQISDCFVLIRGPATPIQKLGLQYMDKVHSLLEVNDKLVTGRTTYRRDRPQQDNSKNQSGGQKARTQRNDNKR